MLVPGASSPVALAHLLPPVATIVLSAVVAVWLWRTRKEVRGLGLYLLLVVVGMVWQTQLVGLVLTTNWSLAQFFVVSEKFVGFLASFVWVLFVAEYTDSDVHRRRWVQGVLFLVVGGYAFLAVTNPVHRLLFVDIVQYREPFFHGSAVRGPVYFVFLAITYGFVTGGVLALAKFMTGTSRSVRVRIALLGVGAFTVGTANLSSVAGLGPVPTFQYGGYGVFPFILATTLGVFGMGLFDLAPVARTSLVTSLDDAVVVVDEQRRIVDYNRRAVELRPELPDSEGEPFDAACPELASRVEFPSAEARTSEVTLTVGGEPRYFSLLVSPVERRADAARPIGHSLLLRDVTELERSRKRLAAKNRRLDQVAETLSHDLRNPLSIASGYVDLVESDVDDPTVQERLATVRRSHDRMGEIIDDVLAVAREGDDVTDLSSVALDATAREAWENVETQDATLVVPDADTVSADRSRLLTVLENLFRNSVEHGGPGVTVTVETFDGGFSVADDGPGLTADCAERVFEYGYTTRSDGTGLGLAIVQSVADAHGWVVDADHEHDGARVVFTGVDVERAVAGSA